MSLTSRRSSVFLTQKHIKLSLNFNLYYLNFLYHNLTRYKKFYFSKILSICFGLYKSDIFSDAKVTCFQKIKNEYLKAQK
jgi:hypothetical protein